MVGTMSWPRLIPHAAPAAVKTAAVDAGPAPPRLTDKAARQARISKVGGQGQAGDMVGTVATDAADLLVQIAWLQR